MPLLFGSNPPEESESLVGRTKHVPVKCPLPGGRVQHQGDSGFPIARRRTKMTTSFLVLIPHSTPIRLRDAIKALED